MKLSKAAKARIKRMNMKERKDCMKAAVMLADNMLITDDKFAAIRRTLSSSNGLQ